jgi:Ran GTPase-activating protein (RanGAP) involved in mRNA processing and transport
MTAIREMTIAAEAAAVLRVIDDIAVTFTFQRVKENNPYTTTLLVGDEHEEIFLRNMTDEEWEELGRDISNNSYLETLQIAEPLSDRRMSFFFRGLKRSSSIENVLLMANGFGFEGVRSMVPFLQNMNNLRDLSVSDNNITSEGFKLLWGALHNSTIEELWCPHCSLDSIEIDSEGIPPNLRLL